MKHFLFLGSATRIYLSLRNQTVYYFCSVTLFHLSICEFVFASRTKPGDENPKDDLKQSFLCLQNRLKWIMDACKIGGPFGLCVGTSIKR